MYSVIYLILIAINILFHFRPKPPSEKKEVKFADGVCPGEGTSTSEGEETPISPPKPKLPKEKRFKKKKIKVKKKVKVKALFMKDFLVFKNTTLIIY